ncbi:MAG: Dolichyl-phosphate beta-D-mannosyltransferase [Bacilli bacterium]|nr:Dolichyl-phosphate beta-D-mannosyltransferase [Bacilli bacterium]
MLSIIVPTFNERNNVRVITDRICQSLTDVDFEVVFVDDSMDDTPEILRALADENARVTFYHRDGERGLATAVLNGFSLAKGDILTVMDADLQHPPELLPAMLKEIQAGADMVVPSRFVPGGDDGGLAIHRKLVSWVARKIGQVMLAPVRISTDPTSGFFMFKRTVINSAHLNPVGWKILMEILVKGEIRAYREIPYQFQPRLDEASKMSAKEQWNYLLHIRRLRNWMKTNQ